MYVWDSQCHPGCLPVRSFSEAPYLQNHAFKLLLYVRLITLGVCIIAYQVRSLPVVLVSTSDTILCPSCFISEPVHLEKVPQAGTSVWAPATHAGDLHEVLASAWLSPSHCHSLRTELARGRSHCLSPHPLLLRTLAFK